MLEYSEKAEWPPCAPLKMYCMWNSGVTRNSHFGVKQVAEFPHWNGMFKHGVTPWLAHTFTCSMVVRLVWNQANTPWGEKSLVSLDKLFVRSDNSQHPDVQICCVRTSCNKWGSSWNNYIQIMQLCVCVCVCVCTHVEGVLSDHPSGQDLEPRPPSLKQL